MLGLPAPYRTPGQYCLTGGQVTCVARILTDHVKSAKSLVIIRITPSLIIEELEGIKARRHGRVTFPLRVLLFEDRALIKQEQRRTQDRVRRLNRSSRSRAGPIKNWYVMNF